VVAYWVVRNSSNEYEVVIDLIMYLCYVHQPLSASSLWIANAAKRRSPGQLRDYRVELLRRADDRQLNSVGCSHFEASVSLHSKYKGAGVHIACRSEKLVSEEAGGG
jgi:hypothetical protein